MKKKIVTNSGKEALEVVRAEKVLVFDEWIEICESCVRDHVQGLTTNVFLYAFIIQLFVFAILLACSKNKEALRNTTHDINKRMKKKWYRKRK